MEDVKKQLVESPINSMFLCETVEEIEQLKEELNRFDITTITLEWFRDHWRELNLFKYIVVDMRLELTPEQREEIQYINFYLDAKSSRIQEFLD